MEMVLAGLREGSSKLSGGRLFMGLGAVGGRVVVLGGRVVFGWLPLAHE